MNIKFVTSSFSSLAAFSNKSSLSTKPAGNSKINFSMGGLYYAIINIFFVYLILLTINGTIVTPSKLTPFGFVFLSIDS